MNPRLNRIPHARPGGPNDDSEAEPVITKCALCDALIDDGKSDPPPTIMRCPNCGPVCWACRKYAYRLRPLEVCCACGAEVKEAR